MAEPDYRAQLAQMMMRQKTQQMQMPQGADPFGSLQRGQQLMQGIDRYNAQHPIHNTDPGMSIAPPGPALPDPGFEIAPPQGMTNPDPGMLLPQRNRMQYR